MMGLHANNKKRSLIIFYGSQTGQAKAIAHIVHERCCNELDLKESEIKVQVISLDLVDAQFELETVEHAIFVVSTSGEGEPPDNCLKLWRRIRKRTLEKDRLKNLNYALLALGDSNYNRFANFGSDLDRRLEQLGARKLLPTSFADDAVGLEVGTEPFVENLLRFLPEYFGISIPTSVTMSLFPQGTDDHKEAKDDIEPTIKRGNSSLANLALLSLPIISSRFHKIELKLGEGGASSGGENATDLTSNNSVLPFGTLPVMASPLFRSTIRSLKRVTPQENELGKQKVVMEVEFTGCEIPFKAGDSFGFITGNRDHEVSLVLNKMNLTWDQSVVLIIPGVTHFPSHCRAGDLIKYFVELRSVPKKSFLRHLGDTCADLVDQRRLYELSSKEGADDYTSFIRSPSTNILDLIDTFPSIQLDLKILMVNSPPLVPRYYSVINTSLDPNNNNSIQIAFSIVNTIHDSLIREGTRSKGLVTGFMHDLLLDKESKKDLTKCIKSLSINQDVPDQSPTHCPELESTSVHVFKRKNPFFFLPEDHKKPIIMVAAGTGVTPFIGFCKERQVAKTSGQELGEAYIYFGCRDPKEDNIYEDTFRGFVEEGIISKMKTCFSREDESGDYKDCKYVQDIIKKDKQLINCLLKDDSTMVYVCGDVKMMSVDVFNSFVFVLENEGNFMHETAIKNMRDKQTDKKYLQDLWL